MDPIVGTAGWAIPRRSAADCAPGGSALERYAARFRGVEVNSSFYRPHRPSTWARWRDSTPPDFRFAVKLPKTITHERKLVDCAGVAADFVDAAGSLGAKLAVLLVQLPPSLVFDPQVTEPFLAMLTALSPARLALEPRHPSWFEAPADALLHAAKVARVAADPARVPAAATPGGWPGLRYWRLHGSPAVYRSAYGPARVADYAAALARDTAAVEQSWCIFDNTAASAATDDALELVRRLGAARSADPAPSLGG